MEAPNGAEEEDWSYGHFHDRSHVSLFLPSHRLRLIFKYCSACAASTANLGYKIKLVDSSDTLWNSYVVNILK